MSRIRDIVRRAIATIRQALAEYGEDVSRRDDQ